MTEKLPQATSFAETLQRLRNGPVRAETLSFEDAEAILNEIAKAATYIKVKDLGSSGGHAEAAGNGHSIPKT